LKQALAQLIGNALKFTHRGGRVELGAERRGEQLALWVADTGVGIAEEDLGLVFEKFQRGKRTTRQHGAGLGLSLVKSIVELHGGRIDIHSQVDVGTRVTCLLPLTAAAAEPSTRPAAA
jgi:signal transduction histidine kinase